MSTRVAIPMMYTSLRMHLEKGRQWNIVEHLLLQRLSLESASAFLLAKDSNLPWRLVVEVMIRLMRVGWVELQTHHDQTRFHLTPSGISVLDRPALPKVTRPITRKGSFAVDQISGTVFRAREFPSLISEKRLKTIRETNNVIVMIPTDMIPEYSNANVLETLLDEDEECKFLDPSGARPVVRFALVTVLGKTIEGLPLRSDARLRNAILRAANVDPNESNSEISEIAYEHKEVQTELKNISIKFNYEDLLIGGETHGIVFARVLKKAVSQIVIHSTFINHVQFRQHLPLIEAAARRGVKIDVLWGKSDEANGANSTADSVASCRDMLLDDIVKERVHFHGISTGSHAKLILADSGIKGGFIAIVGSCNWLSSDFKSLEVSAQFRDPLMVADVADKLSSMAMGPSGVWSSLTRDLACLAKSIKVSPRPKDGITVQAALVLGSAHSEYVRLARDTAKQELTVVSHRFSPSADVLILTPARAAAKANQIAINLYYCQVTGADGGARAVSISQEAQRDGMKVNFVTDPRLHAKFLAWDNDSVVVTSQNWLSADPPDDLPLSEIGVFLSGPGLARNLVDQLKTTLLTANVWD